MSDFAKEIISVNLEDEMKQSYLDYAMSVIIGRALPDVRDGLKPVHRRVLYAMSELNNDWNKPYKKSARIVGSVIGQYHPHGDTAVYDTMVRMAQPFSMRHMLVDGQGNFGSVDGDSPAAMRYTEVRMSKIAHEILADLDKDTVDFAFNYDESETEPTVMPTKIPTLLINGSSGIAVGMATNIPPHNLDEIISGCLGLINNPDLSIVELMQYIPGPDFPTAAFINGVEGIYDAYSTGRGKVHLRAKTHFETFGTNDGREAIIVTELPYQVNKARLLEKIGEMHKDGKLTGISALRDESDKDGMRMVIELKRGEVADVILNNLYKQTQLQTVFGMNMVAILNGRPYCMNLKEILQAFINHRREVVTRRTVYLLRKARERAHVLEGLGVALANIDVMIGLIKGATSPANAREGLLVKNWQTGVVGELLETADFSISRPEDLGAEFGMQGDLYKLSPNQSQAILELRLHRLTGLEQDKIITEFKQLLTMCAKYLFIIGNDERLMEIIREELELIQTQYSDVRRTEILAERLNLSVEDLITEEDRVVTMSHEGYVKSQPLTDYKAQRRGGRGKMAAATKEKDFVEKLIIANTHDTVLCFSSTGKVYGVKVYSLPVASRTSRGKPFVNVLPLEPNEQISAMLTVREFSADKFVFMATANGTVKKTALSEFARQPVNGKIALDLRDGNSLVGVAITDGAQKVFLFSSNGKVICFSETDVRSMGRTAAGVRGIKLQAEQKVISLIIGDEGTVLNITENGFGKRTLIEKYNCQKRGGQGVIAIQTSERNGAVVGAVLVNDNDEIMLITDGGTLVRTHVAEISVVGRNSQGVTVIKPDNGEKVVGVDKIAGLPEEDELGLETVEETVEVIEAAIEE